MGLNGMTVFMMGVHHKNRPKHNIWLDNIFVAVNVFQKFYCHMCTREKKRKKAHLSLQLNSGVSSNSL